MVDCNTRIGDLSPIGIMELLIKSGYDPNMILGFYEQALKNVMAEEKVVKHLKSSR